MDSMTGVSGSPKIGFGDRKGREAAKGGFADTLKSLCEHVDREIKRADQETAAFAAGKRHDIHEVMVASEKASISFKLLLQVRNKLMDAYQEIMRMQF